MTHLTTVIYTGIALPADASSAADREYVDTLALAVPAAEWAWPTPRRAVALSVRFG